MSVVPPGWNDRISSVRDFASCDVKLYYNGGASGSNTGYINYGTGTAGKNVPSGWNDETSSFRVS